MKATYFSGVSTVVVETSVGTFSQECSESELFDTWLGNDTHDVNVFSNENTPETFTATLYLAKPESEGGGIIDNPIETCTLTFA